MLTDCAFLFFRGIQLRIWDPEIQCDLPCHEDIFDAVHPFTHPEFSFKRSLTAQQAFSALFTKGKAEPRGDLALTMLDSFVLIHSKSSLMEQNLCCTSSTDGEPFLQCYTDMPTPRLQCNCLVHNLLKKCSILTVPLCQTYELH